MSRFFPQQVGPRIVLLLSLPILLIGAWLVTTTLLERHQLNEITAVARLLGYTSDRYLAHGTSCADVVPPRRCGMFLVYTTTASRQDAEQMITAVGFTTDFSLPGNGYAIVNYINGRTRHHLTAPGYDPVYRRWTNEPAEHTWSLIHPQYGSFLVHFHAVPSGGGYAIDGTPISLNIMVVRRQ